MPLTVCNVKVVDAVRLFKVPDLMEQEPVVFVTQLWLEPPTLKLPLAVAPDTGSLLAVTEMVTVAVHVLRTDEPAPVSVMLGVMVGAVSPPSVPPPVLPPSEPPSLGSGVGSGVGAGSTVSIGSMLYNSRLGEPVPALFTMFNVVLASSCCVTSAVVRLGLACRI